MAKTYLYFESLSKDTDLETAIAALCQATSFDEDMARGFLEREFAISATDQEAAETISQTLSAQGVHISYQHNAVPPSVYLREIYARLEQLEGKVQTLTDANMALTQAVQQQPSASDNLVYLGELFAELSVEMRKDVRRSLLSLFDDEKSADETHPPEPQEDLEEAAAFAEPDEAVAPEEFDEPEELEESAELEEPEEFEQPEEVDAQEEFDESEQFDEPEEFNEPEAVEQTEQAAFEDFAAPAASEPEQNQPEANSEELNPAPEKPKDPFVDH
jgi:hypothetical protein